MRKLKDQPTRIQKRADKKLAIRISMFDKAVAQSGNGGTGYTKPGSKKMY